MKRVALFIGIDNYNHGTINRLNCAVNDAFELYSRLRGEYEAEIIRDEKVTLQSIKNAVIKLTKDLKAGDIFLFYYAGHGDEYNGKPRLIFSNADREELNTGYGTLPIERIKEWTNIPGVKRLFINDCCRNNLESNSRSTYSAPACRDVAFKKIIQKSTSNILPPGVLFSCSSGQCSYEDVSSGNGYFTKALTSVLEDRDISNFNQFKISLNEKIKTFSTPGMQTPEFIGELNADFPMLSAWEKKNERKKKEKIEPAKDDLELRARDGEVDAQVRLAQKYEIMGKFPLAEKWYKLATEQNNIEAMRRLGNLYYHGGDNFSKDIENAKLWYSRAAALGDEKSQQLTERFAQEERQLQEKVAKRAEAKAKKEQERQDNIQAIIESRKNANKEENTEEKEADNIKKAKSIQKLILLVFIILLVVIYIYNYIHE